ncbi:MAG: hypothetical protein Pg6C_01890 [Treponemataceae bacterium]|nr:MAG: hypothetical protein Pg6C_01890 [Treponemataceae bacterium]
MTKKFVLLLAMLAIVAGLSFNSCATYSTRNGVTTPVGPWTFSGTTQQSRKVVGSYVILLGLFTIGYGDFLSQTQGKAIDVIDANWFYIFRQIKAVER